MPIDKIIPRKLNTDIDGKLIDKSSMLDALNLYSGLDEGGNIGVLKNVKGNTKIEQDVAFGDNSRVLGSALDSKTNICYFFVSSSSGSDHGIWAYDPEDKLSGSRDEPSVRLIYKSSQFNFPSTGFVKGDVVHINKQTFPDSHGDEFDKDAVIFFTDNKNEPRKINAYRAYSAGGEDIYNNIYAEADFITACPKVPLDPITFSFTQDANRKISNFKGTTGFQFAYQHVYIDGFESAVSVYSDVAFPPSVVQQGSLTHGIHDSYNLCNLLIPKAGPEIESIKILAREGLGSSFLEIEEIERSSLFDSNENYIGVYPFYNDRLAKSFPESEINKQFDSVPRKAKSQSLADNRLMYGNYLDGFDSVNVSCQGQVVYRQRPLDNVDLNIEVSGFIGIHEEQSDSSDSKRKSTGFTVDTSSLPDAIPSGASVSINVTMNPDRNWHIYNSDRSYHQSAQIGHYESLASTNHPNEGNNNAQNYKLQSSAASGLTYLRAQAEGNSDILLPLAGDNPGISPDGFTMFWKQRHSSVHIIDNFTIPARLGTSAANPIILKGGGLVFKVGFTTSTDISSGFASITASTISELFEGVNYDDLSYKDYIREDSLIQKTTSTLNHSLPISNHSLISQPYIGQPTNNGDLSKMIMAVVADPNNTGVNVVQANNGSCPVGYVIFKEATTKFGLNRVDDTETEFETSTKKAFRLSLLSLTDVKPLTCYKSMDYVLDPDGNPPISDFPFQNNWGVLDPADEFFDEEGNLVADFNLTEHLQYFNESFDESDLKLLTSVNSIDNEDLNPGIGFTRVIGFLTDISNSLSLNVITEEDEEGPTFCVFDGNGGPGGGPSRDAGGNFYDDLRIDQQGSIPYCTPFVRDSNLLLETILSNGPGTQEGYYTSLVSRMSFMFSGRIGFITNSSNHPFNSYGASSQRPTVLPLLQCGDTYSSILNNSNENLINYPEPEENPENPIAIDVYGVNFSHLNSLADTSYFVGGSYSGDVFRSFKSNSNHDFGIVYYDERGRHGFVNYLTNVFVPGLSSIDRPEGSEGGPASIALSLKNEPPSWAHYFKIVYGGNSTISDFIQYSVPNAYTREYSDSTEVTDPERNNIYVSLNFLQGSEISYTNSFGAKSVAGGTNMYTYKEGDRLRIVSTGTVDSRTYYPTSHEFDIVNLVDITTPQEGESFEDSIVLNAPTFSGRGQFLVLKDNPDATGFDFESTDGNENSRWSENCIVEIYSPSKNMEGGDKFYFETGSTYRVAKLGGNLVHSPSNIILNKGDVWFRKGALNMKEFEGDEFVDIIDGDQPLTASTSNFKSIFIESSTATDFQRGDFKGYGRPNVIKNDAKETRREASITYSDKTNLESSRPRFSSFNINSINYSDYDYSHGDINYISFTSGYLAILQESRVSLIPLSKNVISDASGGSNIIASNAILGEAIPQVGFKGCDSPESVVVNDDVIYYANKRHGDIYSYNRGQGIKNLSDGVIESAISSAFNQLSDENGVLKMIGGYDPYKDEYLMTIVKLPEITTTFFEVVDQPAPGTDIAITGVLEEPEDLLDVTGFQVFIDTDGDGTIGLNEFIQQGNQSIDIPILNPGQVAVEATFDGLEDLAGQINTTDQNEINQALFDIGQSINLLVDDTTSTLSADDVLEGVVSSYIASQGIDISNPDGVTSFINAAGLSEANLSTGEGGGDEANDFNILSNYDLVAQLIANSSSGWEVPPLTPGVNGSFTPSEYRQAVAALGGNNSLASDLNLDGIVGTSDLLTLLSAFGFPISEEVIQTVAETDSNLPPIGGGDVQSTGDDAEDQEENPLI